MVSRRQVDPFDALLRHGDLSKLLDFFTRLEDRLASAFPRAARTLADSNAPSARLVRGGVRRHYLNEALLSAAADSGISGETRWTDPATWSYPVIRIGGFSLTLGIVETRFRGAGRALRTRPKYVAKLCERNAILDPQGHLFESVSAADTLVPNGSLGGLIVAQFKPHQPDVPAFTGFWVPSKSLRSSYYVRSIDEIISMLRERMALARRPVKRIVLRKPVIRRARKSDGRKK